MIFFEKNSKNLHKRKCKKKKKRVWKNHFDLLYYMWGKYIWKNSVGFWQNKKIEELSNFFNLHQNGLDSRYCDLNPRLWWCCEQFSTPKNKFKKKGKEKANEREIKRERTILLMICAVLFVVLSERPLSRKRSSAPHDTEHTTRRVCSANHQKCLNVKMSKCQMWNVEWRMWRMWHDGISLWSFIQWWIECENEAILQLGWRGSRRMPLQAGGHCLWALPVWVWRDWTTTRIMVNNENNNNSTIQQHNTLELEWILLWTAHSGVLCIHEVKAMKDQQPAFLIVDYWLFVVVGYWLLLLFVVVVSVSCFLLFVSRMKLWLRNYGWYVVKCVVKIMGKIK